MGAHPFVTQSTPAARLSSARYGRYRLTGEGKLSEVDMGTVPDIYLRNQQERHRRRSAVERTLPSQLSLATCHWPCLAAGRRAAQHAVGDGAATGP